MASNQPLGALAGNQWQNVLAGLFASPVAQRVINNPVTRGLAQGGAQLTADAYTPVASVLSAAQRAINALGGNATFGNRFYDTFVRGPQAIANGQAAQSGTAQNTAALLPQLAGMLVGGPAGDAESAAAKAPGVAERFADAVSGAGSDAQRAAEEARIKLRSFAAHTGALAPGEDVPYFPVVMRPGQGARALVNVDGRMVTPEYADERRRARERMAMVRRMLDSGMNSNEIGEAFQAGNPEMALQLHMYKDRLAHEAARYEPTVIPTDPDAQARFSWAAHLGYIP